MYGHGYGRRFGGGFGYGFGRRRFGGYGGPGFGGFQFLHGTRFGRWLVFLPYVVGGGLVVCLLVVGALPWSAIGVAAGVVLQRRHPWSTARRVLAWLGASVLYAVMFWLSWRSWLGWYWGLLSGNPPAPPLWGLLAVPWWTATASLVAPRLVPRWFPESPEQNKKVNGAEVEPDAVPDRRVRERVGRRVRRLRRPLLVSPRDLARITDPPDDDNPRTIPLGLGQRGQVVGISEAELSTHAVLLGSTGSGKTVTLRTLVGGMADLGWDGLVIDLKEDTAPGGLRDFCRDYAYRWGIPYQEVTLSDPACRWWFNALDGMNADEAREAILAMMSFDDHHWKSVMEKMLGQLVTLVYDAYEVTQGVFKPSAEQLAAEREAAEAELERLRRARKQGQKVRVHVCDPDSVFGAPNLWDIGQIANSRDLAEATCCMRTLVVRRHPERTEESFSNLTSPSAQEAQQAQSLGIRLTKIYETEAGRRVLRPSEGRQALQVAERGLIYIGLDSTSQRDLSTAVLATILGRVASLAARRIRGEVPGDDSRRFVVIDEASIINVEQVDALLKRARSGRVSFLLATQAATDFGDNWEFLANNLNIAVVMSQNDAKSAEMAAELIGRAPRADRSTRIDQLGFSAGAQVSVKEDWRVSPETIREFKTGEAVIRVGKPDHRVTWLQVWARDPKVGPRR